VDTDQLPAAGGAPRAAAETGAARTAGGPGAGTGLGWGWVLLGVAGSCLLALSTPPLVTNVDGPAVTWWYRVLLSPGTGTTGNVIGAYLGLAAVLVAWLGVGRRVARSRQPPWRLWALAAAWGIPLLVAPPLFSRDAYSYLAQATLTHLGLSPFTHGPSALGAHGYGAMVAAVSPVWRSSLSPYGPLFLWWTGLLAGLTGHGIVAGVVLLRLPEVVGLVLVAVGLPRLAVALGADPARALWLGLASPLALFELVGASHNDALMVGLLVCALALAARRRPLPAVAVATLGALVKLPAAAAVVLIALVWVRQQPTAAARVRAALASAGVAGALAAAVSVATGLGWGWLSPAVLGTPAGGSIEITPATAIGDSLARLAGLLGVGLSPATSHHLVEAVLAVVAAAVCILVVLRTRPANLVASVAVVLAAAVVAGPALWPWYLTWSLVLLAARPGPQRSPVLPVVSVLACLVLAPTGRILVPGSDAVLVTAGWAVVAVAVAVCWRRGWRPGLWPSARPERTETPV